ncbi:uncharacterized protein FIBRA_09365 [Fibroporia radiculosa]|uniref:Cytochrome P450 n=1 Tax=Fibroporia radiculosa TaxID=599839 RepID=J7RVU9_9APHY|nr:uncharacterized protein FIBRA_09365 [Fibroporia radiculosa]CCM07045.1 predicted protein [Fibroporia radiculosa]
MTTFLRLATSMLIDLISITSLNLVSLVAFIPRLQLPPGPPSIPLIGNIQNIPTSHAWVTYAKWAATYGDVIHVHVFGKSLVVLNSLETAKDILEKHSSVTSDRPHFVMISDLMGWDWAVQFMSVGPQFRLYRKTLHHLLHQSACNSYWPTIRKGTRSLLKNLLHHSEAVEHHLQHHSGGIMMSIIYGTEEGPLRDSYLAMAEDAVGGLVEAGNIGKFLVDFVPTLKHVPDWFPGASFKRKAGMWRKMARDMIEIPYRNVSSLYDLGMASPSVTTALLDRQKETSRQVYDPELIKGIAGVLYVGGADTSLSALDTFILAMLLHPDKQKCAQMEIDCAVGQGRLPEFSDRPSLPYMDCVLSEVLRWNSGVPLGDIEYRGFRIPAGATILVNQWAILRSEQHYSDPVTFTPERFLPRPDGTRALDPREASFGFGRRICPGRYFADDLLWMLMVNILAAFDICKFTDVDGNTIEPSGTYINGLVTRPEPFKCKLIPRLPNLEHLVESEV